MVALILSFKGWLHVLWARLRHQFDDGFDDAPHVYIIVAGEGTSQAGLLLAERLRDVDSRLRIRSNCGGGSFKSQFKRADKSGAKLALILGEDEVANEVVSVKDLRQGEEQQSVDWNELGAFLQSHLELNSN